VIRFAPAVGLVLASPVVLGALTGERSIDDALVALLIGVVASAVGLYLLGVAMRPAPPPVDVGVDDGAPPAAEGPGTARPS
jgi:hypothetical protein